MPDVPGHYVFVAYFLSFNAANKPWKQLVINLQTSKSPKLVLSVTIRVEHQ